MEGLYIYNIYSPTIYNIKCINLTYMKMQLPKFLKYCRIGTCMTNRSMQSS